MSPMFKKAVPRCGTAFSSGSRLEIKLFVLLIVVCIGAVACLILALILLSLVVVLIVLCTVLAVVLVVVILVVLIRHFFIPPKDYLVHPYCGCLFVILYKEIF